MSSKWKREDTELLIITMQQHPCLYNVRSGKYLDRTKKAQAFNNVLEVMRDTMCTITLEEVKQKWRNIRTQYAQELKMATMSKKSGSGRCDVYTPKLWCFKNLEFLRSNTKMRHSGDNMEENESHVNSTEDTEDEIPIEEPPKKITKCAKDVKELRSDLLSFRNKLDERNLATQMEQVDVSEQDDAAWEVQCLMRRLASKKKSAVFTSSTTSNKNILELSMDGVFDEDDFI